MEKRYTAIIIDDERPARLMTKQLLSDHTDTIELIGEATNGKEAIELIERLNPDLIFLDIQMPDMNGFEMLSELKHKPTVIFTTAYEQYAVKAFEAYALDYLVKPIEESRFLKSIEKVKNLKAPKENIDFSLLQEMFNKMQPKKDITALPIKIKDKIILVQLKELVYLKAEQGYVCLQTNNGKEYLSELSLNELEEKLPDNFLRVQRSYIVNKDKIIEINKYFNNRLILVMNDKIESRITTGTTYIDTIRSSLNL